MPLYGPAGVVLELGPPAKVRAAGPPVHAEWCPAWTRVEYDFPERPASAVANGPR